MTWQEIFGNGWPIGMIPPTITSARAKIHEAPSAGPLRALRGGAWNNDSKAIRSTNRAAYAPDARRNDVGFRCAREAKSGGR